MSENLISDAALHYQIIKFFVERGYAPQTAELAAALAADAIVVEAALHRLAQNHGVVLHPDSARIWVAHPFSAAPTNFLVHSPDGRWWGNCAWCSLGIAALLDRDVTITTTLGADGRQVDVHIQDGCVVETDYVVHFPVPMRQAWDNVIYTCSTMLLFESEQHVARWSREHRIPQGDVQPIETIWEFSKIWYGDHLNPDWHKWSNDEAQQIFAQFGLDGPIWNIPTSDARF